MGVKAGAPASAFLLGGRSGTQAAQTAGFDPLRTSALAAMLAQMREVKIDCTGVTSPDELWQRYIDAANPLDASMFGRNLDAFWDAIEGGGPGWPGDVALVFEHSRQLSAFTTVGGQRSYLDALREIADQASIVTVKLV